MLYEWPYFEHICRVPLYKKYLKDISFSDFFPLNKKLFYHLQNY